MKFVLKQQPYLLGARNDATGKAKEAAEMVASNQGLAKNPAALAAANQLFADCEDIMRTRIQTRLAKFIHNPLLDYEKQANSSTAETLLNNVYASGILVGTPGVPGLIGAKTTRVQLDDNVFAGGRISDASAYLKDYSGLQRPNGAPAAIALTRVKIPVLRPGMVAPILLFQLGIIGFDQLAKPAAYYVVITYNIDGRIRLVLGHQADDEATQYPQCLLFTKADMDTKRSLIDFTDTGVRTVLMDHIADLLRKKYSPLIGRPDTTVTQRNDGGGAHGTGSASTREAQLRTQKAFIPLRRAVHNDRDKLAKITHAASELKLTDPSLVAKIRNLNNESGIQNLGALRTTSIPHLLGFSFSVEPGFIHGNRKDTGLP